MDTGSPTVLLQQYLAVMTKGSCETAGDEIFDISNFAPRKVFLSASIKGDCLGILEIIVQAFENIIDKKLSHIYDISYCMQFAVYHFQM
jgi:hypothetical protein